eukprot:Selendium_serpulae@DN6270_c0_g2_i1.p1
MSMNLHRVVSWLILSATFSAASGLQCRYIPSIHGERQSVELFVDGLPDFLETFRCSDSRAHTLSVALGSAIQHTEDGLLFPSGFSVAAPSSTCAESLFLYTSKLSDCFTSTLASKALTPFPPLKTGEALPDVLSNTINSTGGLFTVSLVHEDLHCLNATITAIANHIVAENEAGVEDMKNLTFDGATIVINKNVRQFVCAPV